MNPLDASRIDQSIHSIWRERMESVQVFEQIESTNSFLLNQPSPSPGRFRVAIADFQTDGRGRRGRTWVAPRSSGVCLSLACRFAQVPDNVAGLTVACGTVVASCIDKLGAAGVGLKWPNDIVSGGAKLGGILTECRHSGAVAVVGIGINGDLADCIDEVVQDVGDRKITDLRTCLGFVPSRNELCAGLINTLCRAVRDFESSGLESFIEHWAAFDCLRGRHVSVDTGAGQIEGTADGIDASGALRLQTPQGVRLVVSGSVTAAAKIGSVA